MIHFFLQVHFKVPAAWYCSHYLTLASLLLLEICYGYQQHQQYLWQNLPPVSLILVARCRWYWWCILTCEYLRKFLKKFEMTLMLHIFRGLAKDDHEKNLKQKISWHCPFKWYFILGLVWRGRWNPWRQPPPHRQPTRKWTKYFLLLFRYYGKLFLLLQYN